MSWLNSHGISVLAGVLAGGIVTLTTTIVLELFRERRSARQIAMAFYGELSALQRIVERRRYIEELQSLIDHICQSEKSSPFVIRVTKNYFRVYEENIGKIGLLDQAVTEGIASFYVKANAILDDLQSIDDGLHDFETAEHQVEFYFDMKLLFQETMNDAQELCALINKRYS